MCIVVIKEMGKEFPSVEHIENCVDYNNDGFSLMWNEGGKVKAYRTMNDAAFIKKYKRLRMQLDKDKVAMVIHCRIATHGSLGVNNTHCWTALNDTIGFAHNGILSIHNYGDMTDSETFFRHIFVPIFKAKHSWRDAEYAINAVIGTSKFAFLTSDGVVHHYGNYITETDGCLYSNTSYEGYRYPSKSWGTCFGSSYGSGFGSKDTKVIPVTAVGNNNDDEGFAYGKEEYDDDDWWRYDWRKDYMANKSPIKKEAQGLFTHYDSDDLPLD